jgi:hypothetical protein
MKTSSESGVEYYPDLQPGRTQSMQRRKKKFLILETNRTASENESNDFNMTE